ncbi:MAG: VanZ family protein [Lachnospiraceae bacterium]|nr:VanZ family protein [Lachnospiraceae bacterium]
MKDWDNDEKKVRWLFFLYLLLVIKLTIFKYPYAELAEIARTWQRHVILEGLSTANFTFFKTIVMYIRYADRLNSFENLAGNLLMFIPFGCMLPMLHEKADKLWVVAANAFLFIVGIELFQLVSAFGAFDVDDILLNMAGVFLGFGAYKLVKGIVLQFGGAYERETEGN